MSPNRKAEIDEIMEARIQEEYDRDEYPTIGGRASTPTASILQRAFIPGSTLQENHPDILRIVAETGISVEELKEYCKMRYE